MAVDIVARALAAKAGESANAIVEAFTTGFTFKGTVDYVGDLPASGNTNGDLYIVKYAGSSGTDPLNAQYAWGDDNGTDVWIPVNGNRPYSVTFNATSDWTAVGSSRYAITIPASTHKRGSDATVFVWRVSSGGYSVIAGAPTDGYELSINSSGDVTLTVGASRRFAGKIVIA